jgi:ubiquinone/menaquinone biosynthesis C-methylase UbiE
MSAFSSVDEADNPQRLIEFLDQAAVGLAAMKHYIAAAQWGRQPSAPVLDLGCGVGHDIALLARLGVRAVGVDPSRVMVDTSRLRVASPVVQAIGERLPFRDHAFAGCRMERVLMHVASPEALITEAVRCVQPNGLLTIFEPDWSSLTVNASPVSGNWVSAAKHPGIGRMIGALLTDVGCVVVDRVEERSRWSFSDFERITSLASGVDRAIAGGHTSRLEADQWMAEQRRRAAAGDFCAEMAKILWVATTPT